MSRKAYHSDDGQHQLSTQDIHMEPLTRPESPTKQSDPFIAQTGFPNWPTNPASVRSPIVPVVLDILVDVILLLLSLAFFAFGLTVRYYDQAPTALHPRATSALSQATVYGPSVYPILFACVFGRTAHAILVWRLERGEYVGVLDLLAGSTSLTSTATSLVKLRSVSFLGMSLIAIWALSPIGGQASFRQMQIGTRLDIEPASFTYMVLSGNLNDYLDSDRATFYAIIDALFVASLISPLATKQGTLDTWGNVKIPMIESYENVSSADSQGWFTTDTDQPVYSSLVGVPVSGINNTFIDYEMNLETTYLHLDCPVVYGTNWTAPENASVGPGASMWTFDNDTTRFHTDPADLEPRSFFYHSWGPTELSQCTMTSTYVEVEVACNTSSDCGVSRLRRSQLAHPPPAFSLMDNFTIDWGIFTTAFVTAIEGHEATQTAVQNYIVSPDDPLYQIFGTDAPHVSNGDFATRLGQLMNTYWTCLNAMHAISGGMTPETAYMEGTNATAYEFLANSSTTTGLRSTSQEVIMADRGWVSALCLSSAAMVIASLMRPLVRYFLTQGPGLMINISSLAMRHNAYVAAPWNGTSMRGSDRARLLSHTRVRFGDVEPDGEVGKLAIASLGPPGTPIVARVRKERLYE